MRVQLPIAERLVANGQCRALGKLQQRLLQPLGDGCFGQFQQVRLIRLIQAMLEQQLINRLQAMLSITLGRCDACQTVEIVVFSG